jgi:hypothetical protein
MIQQNDLGQKLESKVSEVLRAVFYLPEAHQQWAEKLIKCSRLGRVVYYLCRTPYWPSAVKLFTLPLYKYIKYHSFERMRRWAVMNDVSYTCLLSKGKLNPVSSFSE